MCLILKNNYKLGWSTRLFYNKILVTCLYFLFFIKTTTDIYIMVVCTDRKLILLSSWNIRFWY